MRPRRFPWWALPVLSLALLAVRASAGAGPAPGIAVEIDPREAHLGQSLTLRVIVPGNAPAVVEMPALPDVTVIPRGRVLGTKGDGGAVAAYRFELVPRRAGELVVPPLAVETGGARVLTAQTKARVLPRPAPPPDLAGREILLDARVSRAEPYVGEALVYTLRLYRAVGASGISLAPPDFPGFAATPLPGQRDGETWATGRRYATTEVDYLLTPLRPGRHVLPPPTALCQSVPGTNTSGPSRDVVVTGPGLTVGVRPLPPFDGPGLPTGLIGRLELDARIEESPNGDGHAAVYVLTLSGRGNIKDFKAPDLAVPDGVKARALPPEDGGGFGPAGYAGERAFRYLLTAARPGDHPLPAVAWAVFDPEAGRYRIILAPALVFRATGTPSGDPALAPPLLSSPDAADAGPPSWPWRLVLAAVPVALYAAIRRLPPSGRAGQAETASPSALCENLRAALARLPDRTQPAVREAAACLARLDRLLYAGEPADPEALAATAAEAGRALRRLS